MIHGKRIIGLAPGTSSTCQLDVLYEDGNQNSNLVGRTTGNIINITNAGRRSFVTIKCDSDGVTRRYTYDLDSLNIIHQTNI